MATFSSEAEARRVFEDYFRAAQKDANGFLYYLPRTAPYTYNENMMREEERRRDEEEQRKELKDMQRFTDTSVQGEDRPIVLRGRQNEKGEREVVYEKPKRGDETPDIEVPDPEDVVFEKKKKKKTYVYLPEYRNLYQWRTLTRMPQLVGIGIPYKKPVTPTFRQPDIKDTVFRPMQDRIKRCIEGVKNRIKNKFLDENEMVGDFWVGDGFFTGFADRVYCWKKQGNETKERNYSSVILTEKWVCVIGVGGDEAVRLCAMHGDLLGMLRFSKTSNRFRYINNALFFIEKELGLPDPAAFAAAKSLKKFGRQGGRDRGRGRRDRGRGRRGGDRGGYGGKRRGGYVDRSRSPPLRRLEAAEFQALLKF
jgi:hypothetical protein